MGFGPGTLNFELRAWTEHRDRDLQIRSDLGIAANEALARANIAIATHEALARANLKMVAAAVALARSDGAAK